MQQKDVHIGKLVKSVFEESGMTVAELARRLYCERTNVYSIFRRKSIDVELLARLSKILNRNFLEEAMRLYEIPHSTPQTLTIQVPLEGCAEEQIERLFDEMTSYLCKKKSRKGDF